MTQISYRNLHFPPSIVKQAVWMYVRFNLSLRDVEELLAERVVEVAYETIRRWVARFGPQMAKRMRRTRNTPPPRWHLDEMYISIGGRWMYSWCAIDQEGKVLDFWVHPKRDTRAALKFMRRLLKSQGVAPKTIVTDKWKAYAAAFRKLGLAARHHQAKWKNNRIEGSHVRVRKRERTMQGFRSPGSAQRFLSIHAAFYNHFNTRRHQVSASEQRARRGLAFDSWREMVAA
jgi:putative transposase